MEGSFEQQAGALRNRDAAVRLAAVKALGGLREERCVALLLPVLGDPDGKVRETAISVLLGFDDEEKVIAPLIGALANGSDASLRAGATEALIQYGRRAVYPMLTLMNRFDKQVKKAIIDILGEISDARATPALLAALNDGNENVQIAAVNALGRIRDDRSVEPLIEALKRDNPHVGFAAVRALERIGNPRAVEPLIKVLSRPILQRVALEALGRMRDMKALHFIVSSLQAGNRRKVRNSALKALVALENGQPQGSSIAIVTKLREAYSKDLFEFLVSALRDPDGNVTTGAIRVLGWLGETKAISSVLPYLEGDHREEVVGALVNMKRDAVGPLTMELVRQGTAIREGIAEVLGKVGDRKGTLSLIRLLSDANGHVRQAAAAALGRIKDPTALRGLVQLFDDPYQNVQAAAAAALVQIKDKNLIPAMQVSLQSEKAPVRCNAARVLGELREDESIPLLAALLREDPVPEVRVAVVEALEHFGNEADALMLEALGDAASPVRIAVLSVLEARNVDGLFSHLDPLLREKDVAVRSAAVRALAGVKDDQVRGRLVQLLHDQTGAVTIAAMGVLCKLRDPGLTKHFSAHLSSGDPEVREAAILALGENGDPKASESLRAMLEDSNWIIRSAAAKATGALRDAPAIPKLETLASSDPDPLVKESALFALVQIDLTAAQHA